MMFGTEFAFQTKDSQRRFFQNMNVQEETSGDVQSLQDTVEALWFETLDSHAVVNDSHIHPYSYVISESHMNM